MVCPEWEYKRHARFHELPGRCAAWLVRLRRGEIDFVSTCRNTKPAHEGIFDGLTPQECPYFAGHYRGENYPCLKHCGVQVHGDGRVGVPPARVDPELRSLSTVIRDSFAALDRVMDPATALPQDEKIYRVVRLSCRIFVEFLRIHPYANGNGHMGRWIIWSILGKYGLWPQHWPLDARPPDPPYSDLISKYRDGDRRGLEKFVLQCLL